MERVHRCARKDLVKLGTEYGGWYVPTSLIEKGTICYCVGAGEDISFDIDLIRNFRSEIFVFDPTPRSISHIESLRKNTLQGIQTPINNDPTILPPACN